MDNLALLAEIDPLVARHCHRLTRPIVFLEPPDGITPRDDASTLILQKEAIGAFQDGGVVAMVFQRDTCEEATKRAAYLFTPSVFDVCSRQYIDLQTMTMLGLPWLREPLTSTPFVFMPAIAVIGRLAEAVLPQETGSVMSAELLSHLLSL